MWIELLVISMQKQTFRDVHKVDHRSLYQFLFQILE